MAISDDTVTKALMIYADGTRLGVPGGAEKAMRAALDAVLPDLLSPFKRRPRVGQSYREMERLDRASAKEGSDEA